MVTYKIQRGDTIDRVTKALGMTWDEFRQVNPDAVGRSAKTGKWIIKAGAEVKGPTSFRSVLEDQQLVAKDATKPEGTRAGEERWTEYTVKRGDTLWGLARDTFGVSVREIVKANNLVSADRIHPGQKIRVRVPDAAENVSPEAPERSEVVASWYGKEYHGKPMANGKAYDMYANTIAHRTLPLGTKVELTNPDTGQVIRAVVTDRGPFVNGRDVDLSYGIAKKLNMVDKGVSKLIMEIL
ncbi:MAG TPA: septal ring lytic transglycosylase RlpA family protein [Syntrophales bacterium]|nr:septal ring lytic transglycosylase RlpA family protein [Syntrophales bacterium]